MKPIMKNGMAIVALSMTLTGTAAYASPNLTVENTSAKAENISAKMDSQPIQIQVNGKAVGEDGFQLADGKEAMLPIRAVTEALGFQLTWHQESYSVELVKGAQWTLVKTGEDQYSINKMYTSLGTAPVLQNDKLYVPVSFVSKVLHTPVKVDGNSVSVNFSEQKTALTKGVITEIREIEGRRSVHLNGIGGEGIVMNIGQDTRYQAADGTSLGFSDLKVGMEVEVEHSLVSTPSLPAQSPAYQITVKDSTQTADLFGTSGTIKEVLTNTDGTTSLLIDGKGLNEQTAGEIILRLNDKTSLINTNGEPVEASALVKDAKVIGFYNGILTRSLPPIGTAQKIVLQAAAN